MGKRRTIQDEKLLRQFLKERNLTRAYNRHVSIINKHKTIKEYDFSTRTGHVIRKKVIIIKSKRGSIFIDHATMKNIAVSRKKPQQAIISSGATKIIDSNIKLSGKVKEFMRDWNIKIKTKRKELLLNNTTTEQSYNKTFNRLRTIETTNIIRKSKSVKKKIGFIVIDATYISADGDKRRIQARSKSHNLTIPSERKIAMEESLYHGSVQVEFSPIDVIINDFWYEYWTDKYISATRVGKGAERL